MGRGTDDPRASVVLEWKALPLRQRVLAQLTDMLLTAEELLAELTDDERWDEGRTAIDRAVRRICADLNDLMATMND